jgi:malate dehydrogenase (oxaloacetate-decarboxylating)
MKTPMTRTESLLARAKKPAEDALRLHPRYRGKVQVVPKVPVHSLADFAIWYTPGVAAPCRAIQADPELVFEHTNRGNTVAVVSDCTRVLGLGDIGPAAGLPVMEGKALLFKYLGGVDAVPICLDTTDADTIVHTVKLLQPSFGGINLEDIAQPKCFRILDALRTDPDVTIPVWHDDQQGTATVVLAALQGALRLVAKPLDRITIALVGMGAAGAAIAQLLLAAGVPVGRIVAVDSRGILHPGRGDIEARQQEFVMKWRLCRESNAEGRRGGIAEALAGADVCLAFSTSAPGTIQGEWVRRMARDAIVFACANPVPEIWPWEATEAGARIVGTGRSDFPNQVNNSLGFPAIFRGALDVRARTITDGMCLAAAAEIAAVAAEQGLRHDHVIPAMDDEAVFVREAVAVAMKAQTEGVARVHRTHAELAKAAAARIHEGRAITGALMTAGLIRGVPAAETTMDAPGHVIDAVAAIPRGLGPIDAERLARLLKVTPSAASMRLQRAARLGLVRRVGRGRYVPST